MNSRREATTSPAHHFDALDGVRGLACLMVIAFHSGIFDAGWMGVDLFFVLSGFLITNILLRAKGTPHYYRNFYIRRTLRIFPIYYAYLFLFVVVIPLFRGRGVDPSSWWSWAYLNNWQVAFLPDHFADVPAVLRHLWSLSIEEQFYLMWPVVVAMCAPRTLRRLCIVGIVGAVLLRFVLIGRGVDPVRFYLMTPTRIDGLLFGAALATLPRSWQRIRVTAAAFGLGVVLLVLAYLGSHDHTLQSVVRNPLFATAGYLVVAIVAASLVSLAISGRGRVDRVFSVSPLRLAGKYSYGAYLFHVYVASRLDAFLFHGVSFFMICTGISFTLAALSWHVFEAPILSYKRLFAGAPPVVAPSGLAADSLDTMGHHVA